MRPMTSGPKRAYLGKREKGQKVGVAVEGGFVQTLQVSSGVEEEVAEHNAVEALDGAGELFIGVELVLDAGELAGHFRIETQALLAPGLQVLPQGGADTADQFIGLGQGEGKGHHTRAVFAQCIEHARKVPARKRPAA